jgi:hypothetical protein
MSSCRDLVEPTLARRHSCSGKGASDWRDGLHGGALVQFLIEGQIDTALGKGRMSKSIDDLNGHTIVCGCGRTGRMLAGDLRRADHWLVVVDQSE